MAQSTFQHKTPAQSKFCCVITASATAKFSYRDKANTKCILQFCSQKAKKKASGSTSY